MKKVLVLTLAGAMIFSTPVMAKEVGAPVAVYLEESSNIGIPAETVHAINEDETIGEHMNNAVVDIWGMDSKSVQSLAVGKGAVIDGVEAPGLTFELKKPDLKRVYAAKTLAADKAGTLMTVVNVHTHVAFENAKVTFYAPGVKAGQAITVYERVDDENWDACPTQVADDQVVVDITRNGHLAFIEGQAVAEPAAAETAAVETKAADTAAVETKAADTAAVETKAADTAAVETKAADTAAVETKVADTAKVEADAAAKTATAADTEAEEEVDAAEDETETAEAEDAE